VRIQYAPADLSLAALLLTGCAHETLAVKTDTQVVDVPVAQKCKPNLNPDSPPTFSADAASIKNLPFPDAAARLRANPADPQAKKDVDSNAYYLLQIMAADRLDTRAWIDRLTTALKGCM
jgi:hypothetical protein